MYILGGPMGQVPACVVGCQQVLRSWADMDLLSVLLTGEPGQQGEALRHADASACSYACKTYASYHLNIGMEPIGFVI